jgi:hypothetical protein
MSSVKNPYKRAPEGRRWPLSSISCPGVPRDPYQRQKDVKNSSKFAHTPYQRKEANVLSVGARTLVGIGAAPESAIEWSPAEQFILEEAVHKAGSEWPKVLSECHRIADARNEFFDRRKTALDLKRKHYSNVGKDRKRRLTAKKKMQLVAPSQSPQLHFIMPPSLEPPKACGLPTEISSSHCPTEAQTLQSVLLRNLIPFLPLDRVLTVAWISNEWYEKACEAHQELADESWRTSAWGRKAAAELCKESSLHDSPILFGYACELSVQCTEEGLNVICRRGWSHLLEWGARGNEINRRHFSFATAISCLSTMEWIADHSQLNLRNFCLEAWRRGDMRILTWAQHRGIKGNDIGFGALVGEAVGIKCSGIKSPPGIPLLAELLEKGVGYSEAVFSFIVAEYGEPEIHFLLSQDCPRDMEDAVKAAANHGQIKNLTLIFSQGLWPSSQDLLESVYMQGTAGVRKWLKIYFLGKCDKFEQCGARAGASGKPKLLPRFSSSARRPAAPPIPSVLPVTEEIEGDESMEEEEGTGSEDQDYDSDDLNIPDANQLFSWPIW